MGHMLGVKNMKMTIIRNLLIVVGLYWLSMWVMVPIAAIYFKIISGITYSGDLETLLMGIVDAIPVSLAALGAGILCVYTIEGRSRKYWLVSLALLYGIFGFLNLRWGQPPRMIDRGWQLVRSVTPMIACFLAGYIALNISQSKTK
jgi:hypothetical protein